MNDAFAWDIGDLAKFALLRQLAGARDSAPSLRLGAVWCYTQRRPPSGHGGHTHYLLDGDQYGRLVRDRDPELYDLLVRGSRAGQSISTPEYLSLLPHDTLHVLDALDGGVTTRPTFWESAFTATASAALIFFDPDNGIGAPGRGRNAALRITYDEIEPFYRRGQSLVIYQHQNREKGGLARVGARHAASLRQLLKTEDAFTLRWHRSQARLFFVIPAPQHAATLQARRRAFLASAWGTGVWGTGMGRYGPDFTEL